MKGLIRNNFYTVEGSLKTSLLVSAIATIVFAIAGKFISNDFFSSMFFNGIVGANLGGFGAVSATSMQRDAASKWNTFELTMPVSRKDVVTARYTSYLLYILIGVFMSVLSLLVFYLVNGAVNLERIGYGFTFGLGFALSIPTFMTPLVLIFGTDKTEAFMVVSVLTGLALFVGFSAVMMPFLTNAANANLIYRASYLTFSIVLFVLSYLLSCRVYQKKDL